MLTMRSVIGLMLLLLAFSASYCQDSLLSKGAKIEFKEETFDFGLIKADSTYYYVFYFKNTGTDTLKIQGVRAG